MKANVFLLLEACVGYVEILWDIGKDKGRKKD
jgi:hypothetical protein